MLLARSGYRVLLVDKATFPSDTMSTHLVHPPGGGRARPVGHPRSARGHRTARRSRRYSFDFGPVTIPGSPRPADGAAQAYWPPADRARRAARRGRRRGGRRAARGLHGRGDPGRRRTGDGHPRPRQGRRDGHRASSGGGGSGRQALAGGKDRAARALQRDATARARLLRVLERAAGGRLRDLHPRRRRPRLGGAADPRRPHLRGPGLAAVRSSRPTARTSRAPT